MFNDQTATHLLDTAIEAIQSAPDSFADVLDQLSAALYVTDSTGTITYFNSACAELVGRTPQVGRDRWCATWKLYTLEGQPLPHDACPMAVAIHEHRSIRDCEAIAERPDGTRFRFRPFPTPLFGSDGAMVGAVNLLLDVTRQRKPEYFRAQAERCRRLAQSMTDAAIRKTLMMMAAKYDDQSGK